MSEVKNVTITVPVGLNGWQQEGSVVINGMKVEFPVGVETEVPETAAALLKELIEAAEKRTENVPANNDYKGSLTVPAGHTLRIEKGANFLNYGDSVDKRVIVPETVMPKDDGFDNVTFVLTSQPLEQLTHGNSYEIGYNGTVYNCIASDVGIELDGTANGVFMIGNMSMIPEVVISGSNPDAPFALHISRVAIGQGQLEPAYAMLIPLDGAESVTLSITEKVNVASGGGGGAGIVVVTIDGATLTIDQPYADVYAALLAGEPVQIRVGADGDYNVLTLVKYNADYIGLVLHDWYAEHVAKYKIKSDGTVELV